MSSGKNSPETKMARDRFVERLTDVVLRVRLSEILRQLINLEEEAAKANESRSAITLSNADISRSKFRDHPSEFKQHLEECVQATYSVVAFGHAECRLASAIAETALKDLSVSVKTVQRDALQRHLRQRPHLQARVSSITYYSPSKWLLEQEMVSRGTPGQPASPNSSHIPPSWPEERGE